MARPGLRASFGVVAIAVALATLPGEPVLASCGSAACFLITRSDQWVESPGAVHVDLSWRYVDQTLKLDGGHETPEVLVPSIDFENGTIVPNHHREISTRTTTLQVVVAYGATSRLTVFGVLPLLVDKAHEHFEDAGTPEERFTSADGTHGVGDAGIGVRYGLVVRAKDLLFGSFTAKFPTGPYKLLDSEGAINEPTIQPGSGSYDGTLSLQYVRHVFPSPLEWFVSGSYRANGRNPLDYRIGDEAILSAGLDRSVGERWTWSVQLNARHAARDDYRGTAVPSTGSRSLTVSPGARLRTSSSGAELYAYVQVPVAQYVNERQLAPRAGAVLGVSKRF